MMSKVVKVVLASLLDVVVNRSHENKLVRNKVNSLRVTAPGMRVDPNINATLYFHTFLQSSNLF